MTYDRNTLAYFLLRLSFELELAGKTDLEELQVDMIIDCFEDIVKPMFNLRMETDETRKVSNKTMS